MDLIDKYGDSLEYCLIERGLRLRDVGSAHFTWHDLAILVKFLSSQNGNPFAVAIHGMKAQWTTTELLLNQISNAQRWLVFAQTKDASKGKPPPKPQYLPGTEPEDKQGKHYGTPDTLENVVEFLGDDFKEFLAIEA